MLIGESHLAAPRFGGVHDVVSDQEVSLDGFNRRGEGGERVPSAPLAGARHCGERSHLDGARTWSHSMHQPSAAARQVSSGEEAPRMASIASTTVMPRLSFPLGTYRMSRKQSTGEAEVHRSGRSACHAYKWRTTHIIVDQPLDVRRNLWRKLWVLLLDLGDELGVQVIIDGTVWEGRGMHSELNTRLVRCFGSGGLAGKASVRE